MLPADRLSTRIIPRAARSPPMAVVAVPERRRRQDHDGRRMRPVAPWPPPAPMPATDPDDLLHDAWGRLGKIAYRHCRRGSDACPAHEQNGAGRKREVETRHRRSPMIEPSRCQTCAPYSGLQLSNCRSVSALRTSLAKRPAQGHSPDAGPSGLGKQLWCLSSLSPAGSHRGH